MPALSTENSKYISNSNNGVSYQEVQRIGSRRREENLPPYGDRARIRQNPELVATLYADYYTEFEPDGIFILARDEDDVAVGYILSSLDYKTFVKTFTKYVMPRVRKLSRLEAFTHFFAFRQSLYMDAKNIPRTCISTFCPRRNTKDTARNLWTHSWITLPKRA